MIEPLISVVTPFHNTAPYLAQCIESVLSQSYSRFEYILVDNCSTDGSGEVAETYARRDHRIRLIRRSHLLSQVQNYNSGLAEMSDASQYCKIVQADDFIFPGCLQSMVGAFEQSESIGLVSSYYLKGTTVLGSGFPYPTTFLTGKEMARLFLQARVWVFGSPSTVMCRSCIVRNCQPFYDESLLSEDTHKCMQILKDWDFGFVHQVLSYMRVDNVNGSISDSLRSFNPYILSRYMMVQRYAPVFLESAEAEALRRESKREYYRVLAHESLRFREPEFWSYQEQGLRTLNERLDRPFLALQVCRELLRRAANPGTTTVNAIRHWKRQAARRRARGDDAVWLERQRSVQAANDTDSVMRKQVNG